MRYPKYNLKKYLNFMSEKPINEMSLLDWGCFHGNLLRYETHKKFSHYTGLDVNLSAIEGNRKEFPDYNFEHLNYRNFQYHFNKNEILEIPPSILEQSFNTLFSFSVFTHTHFEDLQTVLKKTRPILTNDSETLISFYSNKNKDAFNYIQKYRTEAYTDDHWDIIEKNDLSYLYFCNKSNEVKITTNQHKIDFIDCSSFYTFYSHSFLKDAFPKALIKSPVKRNHLMNTQDCLILKGNK